MAATYIYALICPAERVVRYIGKSDAPERRLRQHIKRSRTGQLAHHCSRWIRSLAKADLEPVLQILCKVDDWQTVEKLLIGFARLCEFPLTNTTDGGEGVVNLTAEAMHRRVDAWQKTMQDPGVRSRFISALAAGRATPQGKRNRSRAISAHYQQPELVSARIAAAEAKEAARIAARPAKLAKRGESLRKALGSPEAKARIAERSKAAHQVAENKERHKRGVAQSWQDPQVRASRTEGIRSKSDVMAEKRRAAWADPERAAAMSAAQRAGWADPATKEKALAGRREMWADPVRRAALIEKQKAAWIVRKQRTEG